MTLTQDNFFTLYIIGILLWIMLGTAYLYYEEDGRLDYISTDNWIFVIYGSIAWLPIIVGYIVYYIGILLGKLLLYIKRKIKWIISQREKL